MRMICDYVIFAREGAKPPTLSLAAQFQQADIKVITKLTNLSRANATGKHFFFSIPLKKKKLKFILILNALKTSTAKPEA